MKMAYYIKTEKMKFAFLIKGSCTSIQYTSKEIKEILDQLKTKSVEKASELGPT